MRKALKEVGTVLYPDTPHALLPITALYRKEQAEEDWKCLQAWFKQHGVA